MHNFPFNWYWIKDDGTIYSSSEQALIKADNKNYNQWKNEGNLPTSWPKDEKGNETEASLKTVLAPYGLTLYPPTLDDIKKTFQTLVDEAAENERLKYITNGVGQSMTYQEKVNQATDYSKKYAAHKSDPDRFPPPDENDYLLLKASLGLDGDTLIEVAETVCYAYALWQKIGAAIETTRLKAKSAISEAKTQKEAQIAFDALEWPKL